MSGHLRYCFAASFLLVGLSTATATAADSSNPLAALFGQTAPAEASTPPQPPAEEECLSRPGKSTAPGQHWFYRSDGHRKCWFQAAKGTATSKPPARDRARQHAAAPRQNEDASRKGKTVADAHAAPPRSGPAEMPQSAPVVPEITVVDAAPVSAATAAAVEPAPVAVANPASDQLTPDPTPPQVGGQTPPAATPAATDVAAADMAATDMAATPALAPTPVAVPAAETGDEERASRASWPGVLLIALGFIALLSSSRTVRRAMLVWRKSDSPVIRDNGGGNVFPPAGRPGAMQHPAVLLALADGMAVQQRRDRRTAQSPDHRPLMLRHQHRDSVPG